MLTSATTGVAELSRGRTAPPRCLCSRLCGQSAHPCSPLRFLPSSRRAGLATWGRSVLQASRRSPPSCSGCATSRQRSRLVARRPWLPSTPARRFGVVCATLGMQSGSWAR
eukprot:3851252-Prymnesium_polylepis.4